MNEKLYNYSIFLLSRREYSEFMLREKFKEKEYLPEDIEEVMCHLKEKGYQSDERFCSNFIRSGIERKWGISKIKQKLLYEKKIDREMIESLLEEAAVDEVSPIINILNTKFKNSDLNDYKAKAKIVRHLMSRGYKYDNINKALIDKNNNED